MRRTPGNARRLRHAVRVEYRRKVAEDGAGGATYEWARRGTYRAAVEPIRTNEALEGQAFDVVARGASHRIRMRATRSSLAIHASDRILFRGEIFQLVGQPIRPDGDGKWISFSAKSATAGSSPPVLVDAPLEVL